MNCRRFSIRNGVTSQQPRRGVNRSPYCGKDKERVVDFSFSSLLLSKVMVGHDCLWL